MYGMVALVAYLSHTKPQPSREDGRRQTLYGKHHTTNSINYLKPKCSTFPISPVGKSYYTIVIIVPIIPFWETIVRMMYVSSMTGRNCTLWLFHRCRV